MHKLLKNDDYLFMKILLIGEYSNIHLTLAQALRKTGHKVDVLSDSNLWLNGSDYFFTQFTATRWGVLKNTFNLLKTLPQFLLVNKNKISQLSADGIEYIKKHHCPIKIAKECIDFWEKN